MNWTESERYWFPFWNKSFDIYIFKFYFKNFIIAFKTSVLLIISVRCIDALCLMFVSFACSHCCCPSWLWCGRLAPRQARLAEVVHFHLIHHIKTDNQKVITVAWHQCLPREDRVIEQHRRGDSGLSQGHVVMNVRCRYKRSGGLEAEGCTWNESEPDILWGQ